MTVGEIRAWLERFPPTQEVGILRYRSDLGWRIYRIAMCGEPKQPEAPLLLWGDLEMYPMRPGDERVLPMRWPPEEG